MIGTIIFYPHIFCPKYGLIQARAECFECFVFKNFKLLGNNTHRLWIMDNLIY